jgi:hypothetical protein
MVEVLCHTGVRPGTDSAIDLNDRTNHLAQVVDDFFSHLLTLAHWRRMSKDEVQLTSSHLATAYSTSLVILQELQQDFNGMADYSQQQMKAQVLIDGAVSELSRRL